MTALATRIALDACTSLQDVPFDCPVTVTDGVYVDAPGVYLDDVVLMSEGHQVQVPTGWELVTGFDSWGGVFDLAQYITDGMSQQIACDYEGQVLVLSEVRMDDESEDGGDMPVGWAILARQA